MKLHKSWMNKDHEKNSDRESLKGFSDKKEGKFLLGLNPLNFLECFFNIAFSILLAVAMAVRAFALQIPYIVSL